MHFSTTKPKLPLHILLIEYWVVIVHLSYCHYASSSRLLPVYSYWMLTTEHQHDVVEAHATALNWTDTSLSIHVAKTDFSEMFRPRGSSSVTNNNVVWDWRRPSRSKRLTEICLCYVNAQESIRSEHQHNWQLFKHHPGYDFYTSVVHCCVRTTWWSIASSHMCVAFIDRKPDSSVSMSTVEDAYETGMPHFKPPLQCTSHVLCVLWVSI